MVYQGWKRKFSDKKSLNFMLNLRIEGYTIHSLAEIFHCEPATIRFQCTRFSVFPEKKKDIKKASGRFGLRWQINSILDDLPKTEQKTKIIEGERVNVGSSYAELLRRK